MKRTVFFVILICSLCMSVDAQTIKDDGIVYKIADGVAYVLEYDNKALAATIKPEITYKQKVIQVSGLYEESDFIGGEKSKKTQIRELVFAKGCKEVYDNVACGMKSLKRVVLQGDIKIIGEGAFEDCENLEEIVMPGTITTIKYRAFNGCKNLKLTNLPERLERIGFSAFSNTGIEELIIPSRVKTIERGAFSICPNLHQVIFLGNIKTIEPNLFSLCRNLESVVLPNSVCSIKALAFDDCRNLVNLIMPDRAQNSTVDNQALNVAPSAFNRCVNLTNIKCHNGKVPTDMLEYLLQDCPFFVQKGVLDNPDFDKPLLAALRNSNVGTTANVSSKIVTKSDVDINIPQSSQLNDKTYAVIIGNEDYHTVSTVPYAEHDAKVFAEYCEKTLGLPKNNISIYTNASYGIMLRAVKDIQKIALAHQGNIKILFYYSGHGVPDESTHDSFLLPVDADGSLIETCYSLSKLYKDLDATNSHDIIVMMDACFSGAKRDGGVLQTAARGVAIKAKKSDPLRNMIVLSAATGDETAYPYREKSHGMFTYYLLKKLQESNGDVTLGELSDYIKTEVLKSSIMENKKSQTPTTLISKEKESLWYSSKLK